MARMLFVMAGAFTDDAETRIFIVANIDASLASPRRHATSGYRATGSLFLRILMGEDSDSVLAAG